MRLVFGLQTKLLLSFRQWENATWENPASIVTDNITYYETLPDYLFKLDIPPALPPSKNRTL